MKAEIEAKTYYGGDKHDTMEAAVKHHYNNLLRIQVSTRDVFGSVCYQDVENRVKNMCINAPSMMADLITRLRGAIPDELMGEMDLCNKDLGALGLFMVDVAHLNTDQLSPFLGALHNYIDDLSEAQVGPEPDEAVSGTTRPGRAVQI